MTGNGAWAKDDSRRETRELMTITPNVPGHYRHTRRATTTRSCERLRGRGGLTFARVYAFGDESVGACDLAIFGARMRSMMSSSATGLRLRRSRRKTWLFAAFATAGFTAAATWAQPPPETSETTARNEQLIASTEQQFGKNSLQSAEAYYDLAEAQRRSGEYDAAAKSYLSTIEIYRAIDGAFTPLAINPLTSLGDNYHESGDDLSAVSAYGEARTVNRRTYGLLNEAQIVLLDRLSASLLELNEPIEADAQQLEALRLIERNYPPESEEALAGTYKYAGWLRDRGLFQLERDRYMQALRVIREHYGKDNIRQVEPLVGIGNSFRNQRIPEGQGIGALQDALALLEAAPERDPLSLAVVLRDIGDWEVAFNKVGYDSAEYRRAWQLLDQVENGEELRGQWFTGATYVLREPISLRDLSEEANAPRGHVLVSFDLDTKGETSNVAVVESTPAGLKDEAVLRHIRRSRFRPQLVAGEPAVAQALALQFNFRYTSDAVATAKDDEESQR
jgi:TonB family protein